MPILILIYPSVQVAQRPPPFRPLIKEHTAPPARALFLILTPLRLASFNPLPTSEDLLPHISIKNVELSPWERTQRYANEWYLARARLASPPHPASACPKRRPQIRRATHGRRSEGRTYTGWWVASNRYVGRCCLDILFFNSYVFFAPLSTP